MADFSVNTPSRESRIDRLRREFRNPSMLTVILVVAAVLAVPVAVLLPSWISTAQGSLRDRNEAQLAREEAMVSREVFVPSQIAPWMANQIDRMLVATTPYEWNRTSFTAGPCFPRNLGQLPDGKYSAAIVEACHQMDDIQARYAGECPSDASCNFSDEARDALRAARTELFDAFVGSGLVAPASTEQRVGP